MRKHGKLCALTLAIVLVMASILPTAAQATNIVFEDTMRANGPTTTLSMSKWGAIWVYFYTTSNSGADKLQTGGSSGSGSSGSGGSSQSGDDDDGMTTDVPDPRAVNDFTRDVPFVILNGSIVFF